MWEYFIFAMILAILNIIFIIKRVPLFGISLGLFTLLISILGFVPNTELPVNTPTPYFSIFVIFIALFNMLAQVIDLRK